MHHEPKVKSLAKALSILECFTLQKPELGLTEISNQLGLYKSNVHNIVSTFEQKGYIERNEQNNKYHLGFKILELSYIINSNLGIHKVVTPFMQTLSDEVKETVYFAVPKDGKIIYLDGAYPASSYVVRAMEGESAEMYCTSLGKVILAFLPPPEAARALGRQSMKSYTTNTITDIAALALELDRIRQQGYSIDRMEHEHGICCVGVPVFDHNGKLVGAMSISGPSPRFGDGIIKDYARRLTIAAQQISVRL
jgi:DNA-binding IclR family transcriptional regulator